MPRCQRLRALTARRPTCPSTPIPYRVSAKYASFGPKSRASITADDNSTKVPISARRRIPTSSLQRARRSRRLTPRVTNVGRGGTLRQKAAERAGERTRCRRQATNRLRWDASASTPRLEEARRKKEKNAAGAAFSRTQRTGAYPPHWRWPGRLPFLPSRIPQPRPGCIRSQAVATWHGPSSVWPMPKNGRFMRCTPKRDVWTRCSATSRCPTR